MEEAPPAKTIFENSLMFRKVLTRSIHRNVLLLGDSIVWKEPLLRKPSLSIHVCSIK